MSLCNHPDHNKGYLFGSSIITVVIGALAFIVALNWSIAINRAFEYYESRHDELEARFSFAFLVTGIAITLGFLIMYFIEGERW